MGTKVFAITNDTCVTFKASDMAYDILQGEEGIRPAPNLASRGFRWLQHYEPSGALSGSALHDYILASYDMIFVELRKKKHSELGS